jgi:hypothetical protein
MPKTQNEKGHTEGETHERANGFPDPEADPSGQLRADLSARGGR